MKKLLSLNFIFFLASTSIVNAQLNPIPNNSFENWSTVATYEDPDGWTTYNSYTPTTPTTVKTTPSFEGNSAMKLQVVNDPLLGVNTGYAQTSFNLTSKPLTLSWFTKCNIALTGDSVSLIAMFYSGGTLVGDAMWAQGTSITNYTKVVVPINYYNSSIPDSADIFVWAGDDLNFMIGTNLVIDKIEFDSSAGIEELSNIKNIHSFPNPVKDQVTISFSSAINEKLNFKIYNTMGQLILSDIKTITQGNNDINCDVSELKSGIYFMSLENGNEKTQVKIVKE